ncbi:hypothetical protein LOTGIDRAFT_174930 [Lottia gigantea]|uniref:Uncharacterized protein n=1 Tax=Lottia gigantea TaxID=225164 RepID=V3ZXI0_LOTGI|nr:hypothetical protein LOTGIDRAFT_174930 [Lottia gigantea]ESO96248.1 hypothetical protein LOTGIDRAFT_174930 [Lottia gigantea]
MVMAARMINDVDEHLEHLLERIHRKFNQKEFQHPCTRYVRYRTRIGAPSVNRRSFTEEDLVRFAEKLNKIIMCLRLRRCKTQVEEEMKNSVYIVIIPVLGILCIYSITTRWYHNINYVTTPLVNVTSPIKYQSLFDPPTCPGGIQQMLEGKWHQRKMTPNQEREINDFLKTYRGGWGLPDTLQRKDLLCGNASFAQDPKVVYRMFRALCSPTGKTPCCMNKKCVAKTVKECQCKDCLDLRQEAHAEYSDWVPSNHNCKIRLFKGNEACKIFDGMTVVLSGDSLMRQIYIAFQKILNHDMIWGSLKKNAPIEQLEKCKGLYSFTFEKCRELTETYTSELCNGRVNLTFFEYYNAGLAKQFIPAVQSLTQKSKSLVITGIANHDKFDTKLIYEKYLKPAIQIKKVTKWPKLLWTMPPVSGLLRETKSKIPEKEKKFVKKLTTLLNKDNVPIFDTYKLTQEENDGFPLPSTEAEIQAFDNEVFMGYDSDIERSEVKQKPRSRSIPELYHNLKVPKFTGFTVFLFFTCLRYNQ